MNDDARRYAPAAARNRAFILTVLQQHLPQHGLVLEVASGTGEHITYFAQVCNQALVFQPSDPDPDARDSIDAWTAALSLPNVLPAIALDAASHVWPVASADVVVCINMIHITPWGAAIGLIEGAARVLPEDGLLFLYGPFRRAGRHTAASNEAFDQELRRHNPSWGVRDLDDVTALAAAHGFSAPIIIEMPANNLSVVMRFNPRSDLPQARGEEAG